MTDPRSEAMQRFKFRKKPVGVWAVHWFKPGDHPAVHPYSGNPRYADIDWRKGEQCIDTLEGTMFVTPGDWIIEGVEGEFYPCKPAIFEKTYEPVDALLSATAPQLASAPLPDTSDEERVRDLAQRMLSRWNGPSEMLLAFLRLLLPSETPRGERAKEFIREANCILNADMPCHRRQELEAELAALRSTDGSAKVPEGMVLVSAVQGMTGVYEKVGKRLIDFYAGRFALIEPVQHTDNERQVLLVALRCMMDVLAAAPTTSTKEKG
jgi:hypothetical protein